MTPVFTKINYGKMGPAACYQGHHTVMYVSQKLFPSYQPPSEVAILFDEQSDPGRAEDTQRLRGRTRT